MILQLTGWLVQEITMPLWAFIAALLLPAAFFAKLAKEAVEKRFKLSDND